ncbi:hypothetical protein Misp06_01025 [Microbulbifer sp. NBRC 101763]|uniref:hypothetical protein n=1 Tax=Microbulbifer sp. NBRC 101763 TaxID=1113820 RepID=UPI0030B67B9B
MNIKLMPAITTAILLAGCSATQNTEDSKPNGNDKTGSSWGILSLDNLPSWIQDEMLKDKIVDNKSSLEVESLNFKREILGKVAASKNSDGTWYYLIDIDTSVPIECYIFNEYDGPANSLYGLIDSSLAQAEELNNKSLSARFNYAVDVGITENTPYLSLDTLYFLGEKSEAVAGLMKGLSAEVDGNLQVCLHNQMGYHQAFVDVFESFIGVSTGNNQSAEFFESVHQMKLNDISVGYSYEKYTTDDEGDINIQSRAAFIFPVDASSISASDFVSSSWSRPDGYLINASEYSIDNGELTSHYSIKNQNDKWLVGGEFQGKKINSELDYTGMLLSNFGSYLQTAHLNVSDQDSAEFYMWLSDADPTSAQKVLVSKLADNPSANFKMDIGPIVMKFTAEDSGIFKQGTMKQGPLVLDMELLHVKGEPKLP